MREISNNQLKDTLEFWEDKLTLQQRYVKAECSARPQVSAFAEKLAVQVIRNSAVTNLFRSKVKSIDPIERGRLMLESADQMRQRFDLCPGPSIVDPSEVDKALVLPSSGLFNEVHSIPDVAEVCGLPNTEPQV